MATPKRPLTAMARDEVDPEVARQFSQEGSVPLDPVAAVPAAHIDTIALCTRCRADLFHSWRRDGPAAGRMVSYIRVCAR